MFSSRVLLVMTLVFAPPFSSRSAERAPDTGLEPFPDASAVYLEKEHDWHLKPWKSRVSSYKNRLLIRDRGGLGQADQVLVYGGLYGNLKQFSAKVILPDGEEVPVPKELMNDRPVGGSGSNALHALQFTFPKAQPGAVLEWAYTLVDTEGMPLAVWTVRDEIPVLESRFDATVEFPGGGMGYGATSALPQVVAFTRGEPNDYCEITRRSMTRKEAVLDLVCRDLPAIEDESLSPPIEDIRLDFIVTLKFMETGSLTTHHRRQEVEEKIENVQKFIKKNRKLPSSAEKGGTTQLAVAAIHEFLTGELEVRSDFSTVDEDLARGRPRNVDEVLDRGGGTPEEVTLVALAMLEKAGVWVRPVLAHDRTQGIFEEHLLGGADHLMLELRVGDQPWFWDPGCRYCPPGMPHWRYRDTIPNAIRLDHHQQKLTIPPSPSDTSREEYIERVSIVSDGTATIQGTATWSGHEEVWMRESWDAIPAEAREDSFRRRLPGTIRDFNLDITDPEDLKTPLRADYRFSRGDLPRTDDGRLLLFPTDTFLSGLPVPIQENRSNPIWLPFQYSVSQETVFELGDGFVAPTSLPEETRIQGPGLSFHCSWHRESDSEISWRSLLEVSTTRIGEEDYTRAIVFASSVRKALKCGVVATPADASRGVHQ